MHRVGEKQNKSIQLCFNGFLEVDFQGSRVTSDGGLILVRELDEHLGLSQLIEQHLTDPRGTNSRLPLADLLRQSVYSRLAGYEDVNDAERLSQDPTFRLIGSEKTWDRGAALTSRLQSFETELLAEADNLAGLRTINRELIAKATAWRRNSGPGTCTAPTTGKSYCCPRSSASTSTGKKWWCAPTRPLPSRRSTRRWKGGVSTTPSASRPTRTWNGTSPSCCCVRWGGPASNPWSSTRVFSTRQRAGRRPAE